MNISNHPSPEPAALLFRQGRSLLQVGSILFLLALITGLFVQKFAVPRLGLSAHLLGLMQGLFLMVAGLFWPKLALPRSLSTVAFGLVIYGCFGAWSATVFAGVAGAGNSLLPIAAGAARGNPLQETIIATALRSAAVALIVSVVLIIWGLRTPVSPQSAMK
jgi:(hydroxyamino)benzene mutase